MQKKKVAFYTLGCKLNFSETSTIARSLDPEMYKKVEYEDGADIYIINTCSVTDSADKKCRQIINKTVRKSPEAYIIVVGCYAQLKPEEVTSIKGVDLVLGVNERFNLASYMGKVESQQTIEKLSCSEPGETGFNSSYSLGDRTRSFLKVQDGCDYMCAYCTIPIARGNSRNQSIENCIDDARIVASQNIKEIVITGVNIGDFGRSTGENFYSLLKELVKVDGIDRYRISSIEPNLLSSDIIKLVEKEPKLLPHFHIPLQSGSNKILKLMKRRYMREVFADRIETIRELMPLAAIGADVIVGFPGENEADFADTYDFIADLDISYLHAFSYSARDNTPAASFKDQVDIGERHRRSKMLQKLSESKRLTFSRKCIGKDFNVLWENSHKDGVLSGFTENYIRVSTVIGEEMKGKISRIKLKDLDENGNFIVSI